jgi:hypothetical protein
MGAARVFFMTVEDDRTAPSDLTVFPSVSVEVSCNQSA